MATHSVTPVLGANFAARDTEAKVRLMTRVTGSDGYDYIYVQANGAIAASQTDISVVLSTGQASDGSGLYVNTTAFADNEYGWVRVPREAGVVV